MSLNINKAARQGALKTARNVVTEDVERAIEAIVKGDSPPPPKEEKKTRPKNDKIRSVQLDYDMIQEIDKLARKDRKTFSQVIREFCLDGLRAKGISI